MFDPGVTAGMLLSPNEDELSSCEWLPNLGDIAVYMLTALAITRRWYSVSLLAEFGLV